MQPKKEHKKTN